MPIYPLKGARGITYQARWGRNPKNGQPFTKNFKLRKEAVEFLSTVGSKPYISDRESLTIGQAIDQWLTASGGAGTDGRFPVRPGTLDGYKKAVKPLRSLVLSGGAALADIKLSKMTKGLMIEIRDALIEAETRDTAARAFNRLKSVLLEAQRREQLVIDPVRGVAGIVVKNRDAEMDGDDEVVIPQPDEVRRLLTAANALSMADDGRTRNAWRRYRPMIETAIYTGMRPCELRGLARRHVLTDRRVIQVRRSADEKGRINPPKTPSSKRDIVIPKPLADALDAFMATLPADPDALVFGNRRGKPEHMNNIYRFCWRPLLEAAGLADYTLYSLRHFYASMLISMGVREKRLTAAMGHRSVAFTMDIYGKLFKAETDQDAATAVRLSDLLNDVPSENSGTDMIRDNVTSLFSIG